MEDQVKLQGKVSKLSRLSQLPSGIIFFEGALAFEQYLFGEKSVGYIDFICFGEATRHYGTLRIGKKVRMQGSLFSRTFQNKQGFQARELKILSGALEVLS